MLGVLWRASGSSWPQWCCLSRKTAVVQTVRCIAKTQGRVTCLPAPSSNSNRQAPSRTHRPRAGCESFDVLYLHLYCNHRVVYPHSNAHACMQPCDGVHLAQGWHRKRPRCIWFTRRAGMRPSRPRVLDHSQNLSFSDKEGRKYTGKFSG